MNADQKSLGAGGNQPGAGEPESANSVARSIAARARQLQRALSPWVQRWLTVPGIGREAHPDRYSQTALTKKGRDVLLGRVQRTVERGTVWQAGVGSLAPTMVERFTSAIVERFPDASAKYGPRPLGTGPAETVDLILASGPTAEGAEIEERPVGPEEGVEIAELSSQPTMAEMRAMWESKQGRPPDQAPRRIQRTRWPVASEEEAEIAAPAPQPTMAEMRAMWESKRGRPAEPPPPDQVSSQVQRAEAGPRWGERIVRRFSRIEEITPSGRVSTRGRALETQPARVDSTQPEPVTVPERPVLAPEPGRQTVQREVEGQDFPQSLLPEPPRLPVAHREVTPERLAAPPTVKRDVLREEEVAEAAPAQPPLPSEEPPPLIEVEAPEPPVIRREVTLERPAALPAVHRDVQREAEVAEVAPSRPPLPAEEPLERPVAPPTVQRDVQREAEVAEAAPSRPPLPSEEPPPGPEISAPPLVEIEALELPIARREVMPDRPVAPPTVRQDVQREAEAAEEAPSRPSLPSEEPSPGPEAPAPPLVEAEARLEPGPSVARREVTPERPAAPPTVRRDVQREAEAAEEAPSRPSLPSEEPPPGPEAPAPPLIEAEAQFESGPPAARREVAPERPAAPPTVRRDVQREVETAEAAPLQPPLPAEEPPPGPEMPVPPMVQREPELEVPAPTVEAELPSEPGRLAERSVAGLEEDVLARAASGARMPLSEPLRPTGRFEPVPPRFGMSMDLAAPEQRPSPVTHVESPVRMATLRAPPARVQARLEDEEPVLEEAGLARAAPGRYQALEGAPPLPLVSRPPSTELVQSEAEAPPLGISLDLAPPLRRVEVVQRAEEEEMVEGEPPAEGEGRGADLDDLARQIYPLIRRMLAVERERRPVR